MNVFFQPLISILLSLSEICKFIVDNIKSGLIKFWYRCHKTYRILIITMEKCPYYSSKRVSDFLGHFNSNIIVLTGQALYIFRLL